MDIHARLEDRRSQLLDTEPMGGLEVAVGELDDFSDGLFNFFVFFLRENTLTVVKRTEKIYSDRQLLLPF